MAVRVIRMFDTYEGVSVSQKVGEGVFIVGPTYTYPIDFSTSQSAE